MISVSREDIYSHSYHYLSKIGDCTTIYKVSLLIKYSFGVTFQHPFHALEYEGISSDILSHKALLDYVNEDNRLFRSTRVKSGYFNPVLSNIVSLGVLSHVKLIYS